MTGPTPTPTLRPVTFFVEGLPASQGSKNATVTRYGKAAMWNADKKLRPWRDQITIAARVATRARRATTGAAVALTLTFRFPRPARHYGTGRNADRLRDTAPTFHTIKPDLDKLTRAVLDALTNVIYDDDSQVVELDVRKAWATDDLGPGVWIHATTIEAPAPW